MLRPERLYNLPSMEKCSLWLPPRPPSFHHYHPIPVRWRRIRGKRPKKRHKTHDDEAEERLWPKWRSSCCASHPCPHYHSTRSLVLPLLLLLLLLDRSTFSCVFSFLWPARRTKHGQRIKLFLLVVGDRSFGAIAIIIDRPSYAGRGCSGRERDWLRSSSGMYIN